MTTTSITYTRGSAPPSTEIRSVVGEAITLTITLRNADGTARNCTGGVVSWCFGRRGSSQLTGYLEVDGEATGIHVLTLTERDAALLDGNYQHDAWYYPASGARERAGETSVLILERGVGPVNGDPLNAVDAAPSATDSLPLQSTIEIAGVLDLPGTSQTTIFPTVPACRAYHAAPLRVVVTVAQLQGAGADPGAVGTLTVARNGQPVCTPIAMTHGPAGVFTGTIGQVEQALISVGDTVGILAFVRPTNGVDMAAHQVASATFVESGKPVNLLPVVTITSPANGATVAPGAVTVAFSATDADGVLSAESFESLLDGSVVAGTLALTSGAGTSNVAGTVSVAVTSAGAHTISVRCTDAIGGQTTTPRAITVAQPTLTITSPQTGATVDEGPRHITATTDLAMPANTALVALDGETVVGTGTLGSGVTTSSLSAGVHNLSVRIVTSIGAVTSTAVQVTAVAQAPTIAITSPTSGATTVPAATVSGSLYVTHPGGAGEIAAVAVWRSGQSRVAATRVGSSDVWAYTVTTPGTEGTWTINADATDVGGTVTTATPITVVHSYAVAWTGSYAFGRAYATTSSPSSGAQTLTLSATVATNGAQLRATFPAGVTGANIVPPAGYSIDWTTPIVPVSGAALHGLVPWSDGGTWEVLLQLDTEHSRILASARWTYVAPADLVWLQRDSVVGGTVIGTWTSVTDPMAATYGVSRGNVRQGGSGALVIPLAVTSTAVTVLANVRTLVTSGSPSIAFFAGSYESDNSTSQIGFGDFEMANSGDTLEMWCGFPAQGIYVSNPNAPRWQGGWEDNNSTSRISFSGWNADNSVQAFPNLRGRWLTIATSLSSNAYTRRINGMTAITESFGGTVADAPEGILFGAERNGTQFRNAEMFFSDPAVCPRAMSAAEIAAYYRETQGTLTATADYAIRCFILGSSYMTVESGQTNRMAHYVVEQGTELGVTVTVVADFAYGAQGVSTPSSVNANLQSQINRLLLDERFHRGALVFVDYMAMVNEQVVYGTSRATARTMITAQLDRLRVAGCTLIIPQVSSCVLGGVTYGPDARADQLEDWISVRPDCQILYVNAALQADPAANFYDQGTPGQPETYGPHLAEPVGSALTGKRLVARAAVQAMIGLHQGRLGKYVRP